MQDSIYVLWVATSEGLSAHPYREVLESYFKKSALDVTDEELEEFYALDTDTFIEGLGQLIPPAISDDLLPAMCRPQELRSKVLTK